MAVGLCLYCREDIFLQRRLWGLMSAPAAPPGRRQTQIAGDSPPLKNNEARFRRRPHWSLPTNIGLYSQTLPARTSTASKGWEVEQLGFHMGFVVYLNRRRATQSLRSKTAPGNVQTLTKAITCDWVLKCYIKYMVPIIPLVTLLSILTSTLLR